MSDSSSKARTVIEVFQAERYNVVNYYMREKIGFYKLKKVEGEKIKKKRLEENI